MRYEIDEKHKIVDLYIEDDSGKEVHDSLSFDGFEELAEDIIWKIKNPTWPRST